MSDKFAAKTLIGLLVGLSAAPAVAQRAAPAPIITAAEGEVVKEAESTIQYAPQADPIKRRQTYEKRNGKTFSIKVMDDAGQAQPASPGSPAKRFSVKIVPESEKNQAPVSKKRRYLPQEMLKPGETTVKALASQRLAAPQNLSPAEYRPARPSSQPITGVMPREERPQGTPIERMLGGDGWSPPRRPDPRVDSPARVTVRQKAPGSLQITDSPVVAASPSAPREPIPAENQPAPSDSAANSTPERPYEPAEEKAEPLSDPVRPPEVGQDPVIAEAAPQLLEFGSTPLVQPAPTPELAETASPNTPAPEKQGVVEPVELSADNDPRLTDPPPVDASPRTLAAHHEKLEGYLAADSAGIVAAPAAEYATPDPTLQPQLLPEGSTENAEPLEDPIASPQTTPPEPVAADLENHAQPLYQAPQGTVVQAASAAGDAQVGKLPEPVAEELDSRESPFYDASQGAVVQAAPTNPNTPTLRYNLPVISVPFVRYGDRLRRAPIPSKPPRNLPHLDFQALYLFLESHRNHLGAAEPEQAEVDPALLTPEASSPVVHYAQDEPRGLGVGVSPQAAPRKAPEDGLKRISELRMDNIIPTQSQPENWAEKRSANHPPVKHGWGYNREWASLSAHWQASAARHYPLYFEDVNLERHGYSWGLLQPAVSAAHFFGRVPALPYLAAGHSRRECIYTLGHYRPGSCAPHQIYTPEFSWKAALLEGGAVTGLFYLIP